MDKNDIKRVILTAGIDPRIEPFTTDTLQWMMERREHTSFIKGKIAGMQKMREIYREVYSGPFYLFLSSPFRRPWW